MRLLLVLLFCVPLLALRVRIAPGSNETVHDLYAAGFTVGEQDASGWDVYADSTRLEELNRIVPFQHVQARRTTIDNTNYYDLMKFCSRVAREHPEATRFAIGKSVQQRELLGVRIRTAPRRKKIKLVANMHGDETVGRELLVLLVDHILTNKGDPDIKALLDVAEIHVLPSMNPDGFARGRRTNALGYDLNRNFPDRFFGQITPIQPETRAIMEWSRRENFTLSANLHGGALVANYPFDGNRAHRSGRAALTEDDALFRQLAHAYADNHPEMRVSTRFSGGVTNGAKWYVLYGGMQDWNYLHTNDKEITVEVSRIKRPRTLAGYWEKNKKSLIEFMKQIHLF